jgi:hypothetical protein
MVVPGVLSGTCLLDDLGFSWLISIGVLLDMLAEAKRYNFFFQKNVFSINIYRVY